MKRVALCVGINDYPGTDADLNGCVNDAFDWRDLLQSRGYEVQTLIDGAATKANIVTALELAVDNLSYRDRFVFTFSGHGTWTPDGDGDEVDGRDEALCCHEVWEGGILTDDEMHLLFKRARHGTQITVLSDSCHSGTVARGLLGPQEAAGEPRFLSPGVLPTIALTVQQAARAEQIIRQATSRPGPVLISGCDDPEFSYDASFNGRPNGAFTRAAIDTLTPDVKTFKEWYSRIRGLLPSANYPQSPQLGASSFQKRRVPLG